nr:retrovirus-related Pol polyprotein from transposon TNT 1-94 [Tanacetum cinerariifolium]
MAGKFKIKKFNGNNFSLWKLKMKAILTKDKCLAAIGERPAEVTDDSKWAKMDRNAIANLYLALADGVLSSIEEKKTVKDIWDHLTRLYEARSLHNNFFLKRKRYALRMTEATSVTEHVNNLNTLFYELTSLDCKIEPQEHYLVFDDIAAAILEEENRRNNKEDMQTSFKTCGCLGGDKREGNIASTSDDGNAVCCEAAVANEDRNRFSDVWLFDTGAIFHMIERREWFHQYKPISGGEFMDSCNDHELKIIGIKVSWNEDSCGKEATSWPHKAPVQSLGGAKYFVSFTDDYSRRCWVYPIKKKKSNVFEVFKVYKARVKLDYGKKNKCLRTYNQGEYTGDEFDTFCKQEGIKRQFITAYTPQQNKVAGRMNRTLLERSRAMLATASLEKSLWTEAVNTACCVINRSPSTTIELKTPMEMWTEKPVNYSDLHIFGSHVYVIYNTQETTKLDPKSKKCFVLGTKFKKMKKVIALQRKLHQYRWKRNFSRMILLKLHLSTRLNKSLYGLRQAPRSWYKRYDSFIRSLEYNRLHAYPYAYFKRFGNNNSIILLLYVDDMLVPGLNNDRINKLKAQLAREFEMKDLGPANKILGMQIHRDRVSRKIWLSLKSYVKKILQSEKERMKMSRVPYALAVESLMFAMICTRPNIVHAVGVVSRYMTEPGREHWEAVKRIFRYIKGTSDVALCFGDSDLIVKGYVDSDYAGDLDGSKSTAGYLFTLSGRTISWVSKLQLVVAMSTMEAEYVAVAQANKEAVWLKMLLEELGHE